MPTRKTRVGLAQEDSRRANVLGALQHVSEEILPKLADRILIKPNFFSSGNQLTATHPDAVRGVLDFLQLHGVLPSEVLVAEGGNEPEPGDAFRNYGYPQLAEEYGLTIEYFDVNHESRWRAFAVRSATGQMEEVRISETVLEHPCVISVAVAKTHDAGVVTLAIKNLIMGCIHRQDRIKVHGYQSHRDRTLPYEAAVISANLTRLSHQLSPDIAVVDGTVCIQGNGPSGQDTFELGIAVAGTDPYATDATMARAMGFSPQDIGLLQYAHELGSGVSDLAQIEVVGPPLESVARSLKPHKTHELQIQWRNDEIRAELSRALQAGL